MNKLGHKIIRVIVCVCVLVLLVDVIYVCYQKLSHKEESKYFDKVMTPYECSMLARYYGKKMLENEHLSKDSRGR